MMLKASAGPNGGQAGVPVTWDGDEEESQRSCYFNLVKYMCATGAQLILTTEQRLKLIDGLITAEGEGRDERREDRRQRSPSTDNQRLQEIIGLIIGLLDCQRTSFGASGLPNKERSEPCSTRDSDLFNKSSARRRSRGGVASNQPPFSFLPLMRSAGNSCRGAEQQANAASCGDCESIFSTDKTPVSSQEGQTGDRSSSINLSQWLKEADDSHHGSFPTSWLPPTSKNDLVNRGLEDSKSHSGTRRARGDVRSPGNEEEQVSVAVLAEGCSGDFSKKEDSPSDGTMDNGTDVLPTAERGASAFPAAESSSPDQTNSEHGGSNQSVLTLWQFLLEMLHFPEYNHIIRWRDKENGIFKIYDSQVLADLWGLYKRGQRGMSFDKMSRAMRFYYSKGILCKDGCEARLDYRFGPRGLWRNYRMPPSAVSGRLFHPPPVRISRRQRRKAAKRLRLLAEMGPACSPEKVAEAEMDVEVANE